MNEKTVLKTSVCIVGAGPAGIVLANILSQNGINCIVIDKHHRQEIYSRGQAGGIESTTVALLKKQGLADSIFRNGYIQDCCEFRYSEGSVVLEYGKLSGGDVHHIYPQNDLTDDLIQKYLDRKGKLLFRHQGKKIEQYKDRIAVKCIGSYKKHNSKILTINADFVAGCDGYHGISRLSIPEEAVNIYQKHYKYSWLTILAYAPPSAEHTIYALHPDGFAGHMLRNDKISRYYLQISKTDEVKDWSDKRIWATLQKRLAKKAWTLIEGEIFSKKIMSLRNYVMEPLRYRRLLMVGDAAHIITPMGGKGLNLAIQDAVVLAETLISYYQDKHQLAYLNRYSKIRLPHIWQAQEFSHAMLNMVHVPEQNDSNDILFHQKLRESKLLQLNTSNTFARDFARKFVGII